MEKNVEMEPQTYPELRSRLLEHDRLSPRLRQIGSYAMANPNVMALETISQIAERAEVAPSSLIRFAQALGYPGFSQMQKVFREGLLESIPDYQARLQAGKQGERTGEMRLTHFTQGAEVSLRQLEESVSDEQLQAAVALLASANRIHVLAHRRSFPVASYLAYALNHLNQPTHLLDGIGGLLQEQVKTVLRGDVLLAISFKPYASEVREVVEQVALRGAKVLAITDSPMSPLVRHTTLHLEVRESEVAGFRTLSSTLCLALALVVGLGSHLETDSAPARGTERAEEPGSGGRS